MAKKKTPPIKMSKVYGIIGLTFGIIAIFYAISPILTGLGVLVSFPINYYIMKGDMK